MSVLRRTNIGILQILGHGHREINIRVRDVRPYLADSFKALRGQGFHIWPEPARGNQRISKFFNVRFELFVFFLKISLFLLKLFSELLPFGALFFHLVLKLNILCFCSCEQFLQSSYVLGFRGHDAEAVRPC